ncbi:MAG TPA: hypothetical protein VKU19_11545 [Bryobacteraceae bacterium]|nr:hypothetical protein [Bryobacteraceae bacterium]
MNDRRPPALLRILPSFTDFAFLMPIVFLFGRMGGLRDLLSDCDTGWHIRTGEWIIANRHVPAGDIFSFSKTGQPWFAWEWLTDVVFAWLNSRGGLQAVVLFSILILALTFTALFRLLRTKSNPFVAIAITMLAAAGSSIHWLARPHLFTLLFLVLFYTALERVRAGQTHWGRVPYLAILPVVTILWTNLHGGFFVGAILIGSYGAGEVLTLLFSGSVNAAETRQQVIRRATRYFLSASACMAASLINPYTWHLHQHMLMYLRDPFNSQHIHEFLSPSFHHPSAIFFEAMMLLAGAAGVSSLAKGRFTEALYMVAWAHGALLAARNIPIFLIVASLPAAAVLEEGLERLPEWNVAGWLRRTVSKFLQVASETASTDSVGRWHLISGLAMVLVAAVMYAPHPPHKFRAEFDPKVYPAAALAKLHGDANTRIFTHDEWGDYLIWTSHKVFVDGRSDFYGDDFEQKYIDILNVSDGWETTLAKFGVDTILMPPNTPLAGALKVSSRWRMVYEDTVSVVYSQTAKSGATTSSLAATNRGEVGRDREVTKTQASDRAITDSKSKT